MVILNNLDKYEDHLNYYELYIKNNTRLNEIIKKIVKTYKFDYDPKKYYRLDIMNINTLNIYELSGIIIMLNSIIEKTFYGYCIKTGVKYACEKMHCSNDILKYNYYAFFFNSSGDEFMIMFQREFFSPILIYYPKTNSVYNISYRHSDILYHIKTNNNNSKLNNVNYNITYYPKNNYISYVIGMINNPGHFFWQEMHGLMLLIEYDLLDNIDEFIIYKYDYLNIADILKNKFNKKITFLTSDKNTHNLTVNISKFYITNSSVATFKNTYSLTRTNDISITNKINILFDIRSHNRIWLNQIPMMINIMNGIKNKYSKYNINFYISGFYNYNKNIHCTNYYNETKEVNTQNDIFNTIQSKVKFQIFNLINMNLSEIIHIIQNINLCITNLGSGVGFYYSTIFNNYTIGFTNAKNSIVFNENRYAFENKLNKCTCIHPSNITDNETNFILKPGVLFNSVISKIDEILLSK